MLELRYLSGPRSFAEIRAETSSVPEYREAVRNIVEVYQNLRDDLIWLAAMNRHSDLSAVSDLMARAAEAERIREAFQTELTALGR